MTEIVGILLAAGAGRRMGSPKAELLVGGERLLDRGIRALTEGGCGRVLAVVRAGTPAAGAVAVVNPDPDRGMRSSLELAVAAVTAAGTTVDAAAVLLVDMPGVTPAAVRAVAASWRPGRIAIAYYGGRPSHQGRPGPPGRRGHQGRRGHPTVMAPAQWLEALTLAGPDEGARALLAACPHLVDEIPVDGDPTDLDTSADLAAWHG